MLNIITFVNKNLLANIKSLTIKKSFKKKKGSYLHFSLSFKKGMNKIMTSFLRSSKLITQITLSKLYLLPEFPIYLRPVIKKTEKQASSSRKKTVHQYNQILWIVIIAGQVLTYNSTNFHYLNKKIDLERSRNGLGRLFRTISQNSRLMFLPIRFNPFVSKKFFDSILSMY